jgi:hypothetical protein
VRRAAKIDGPQPAIVEALRKVGCWVLHLHQIGAGCPDLLVHCRDRLLFLEVKSPGEKINALQANFIAQCPAEIHVVQSPDEALVAVLGAEVMK